MSSLISHLLPSGIGGNTHSRNESGNYNGETFPPQVVRRFRNAQAHSLYSDAVGLSQFQDETLGRKLDEQLDRNFKMLARPSSIARWRGVHESDIIPPEAQDTQSYPHYLALLKGTSRGVRDPVLDLSTVAATSTSPTSEGITATAAAAVGEEEEDGIMDQSGNYDDGDEFGDNFGEIPLDDSDGDDNTRGSNTWGESRMMNQEFGERRVDLTRFLDVYDQTLKEHCNPYPLSIQGFAIYLSDTEDGRHMLDSFGAKIETYPTIGNVYLNNSYTGENLIAFFDSVVMDEDKKLLPQLLFVSGGFDQFMNFKRSVNNQDNEWDLNFLPIIKFMVGKYNAWASTHFYQKIQVRHSTMLNHLTYLKSVHDESFTDYFLNLVDEFTMLKKQRNLLSRQKAIEKSNLKELYDGIDAANAQYHIIFEECVKLVEAITPVRERRENGFQADVVAFYPEIMHKYKNYTTNTKTYLLLLYESLAMKDGFPSRSRQNSGFLMQNIQSKYRFWLLKGIFATDMGKYIQLCACAVYYFYFTMVERWGVHATSAAPYIAFLNEIVSNFNPIHLRGGFLANVAFQNLLMHIHQLQMTTPQIVRQAPSLRDVQSAAAASSSPPFQSVDNVSSPHQYADTSLPISVPRDDVKQNYDGVATTTLEWDNYNNNDNNFDDDPAYYDHVDGRTEDTMNDPIYVEEDMIDGPPPPPQLNIDPSYHFYPGGETAAEEEDMDEIDAPPPRRRRKRGTFTDDNENETRRPRFDATTPPPDVEMTQPPLPTNSYQLQGYPFDPPPTYPRIPAAAASGVFNDGSDDDVTFLRSIPFTHPSNRRRIENTIFNDISATHGGLPTNAAIVRDGLRAYLAADTDAGDVVDGGDDDVQITASGPSHPSRRLRMQNAISNDLRMREGGITTQQLPPVTAAADDEVQITASGPLHPSDRMRLSLRREERRRSSRGEFEDIDEEEEEEELESEWGSDTYLFDIVYDGDNSVDEDDDNSDDEDDDDDNSDDEEDDDEEEETNALLRTAHDDNELELMREQQERAAEMMELTDAMRLNNELTETNRILMNDIEAREYVTNFDVTQNDTEYNSIQEAIAQQRLNNRQLADINLGINLSSPPEYASRPSSPPNYVDIDGNHLPPPPYSDAVTENSIDYNTSASPPPTYDVVEGRRPLMRPPRSSSANTVRISSRRRHNGERRNISRW